ncbi:MAG: phosphoglycerate kinase [Candidatus Cloacimonetes bacterium]|nr:phosphoglycerate kinase [Candidatus Cloacimonadota bacterium]
MKLLDNLPRVQEADVYEKVVLMRVDHNVIKKGKIKDPARIEATIPTILRIIRDGGHIILMTHVGRPRDKKTGAITMSPETSVQPIVEYLEHKYGFRIGTPEMQITDPGGKNGILGIDTSINQMIRELRDNKWDMLYLPNTRWFHAEELEGDEADHLGEQMASLADVYVNDAFGSWQPHVSTVKPPEHIPSYAGLLMQLEIENLEDIFRPQRPFVGIVAGSKYDTKIGPLNALLDRADHVILGGVLYNAYLAAKYGFHIEGLAESEIESARQFIATADIERLLEPRFIVESDTMDGKIEGKWRVHDIRKLKKGAKLGYVLDAAPESFDEAEMREAIGNAGTIFTNAVMGFTPHFGDGSKALYECIGANDNARKLFGGGDTLQDFKSLLPGLFAKTRNDRSYYFFTGGGTILTAIEEGSAFGLAPVRAILRNRDRIDGTREPIVPEIVPGQ